MFSPLHFLNISDLATVENFNAKIGRIEKKRPALATKRIQAVLRYACKRRKPDSTIDGKPLLQLPPKTITSNVLKFDDDEHKVYLMIEQRARARFNRYLRAGTVMKHFSGILAMITRSASCPTRTAAAF